MPIFQRRSGAYEDPPSTHADFPAIPTGALASVVFYGGHVASFFTNVDYNAEQFCDHLDYAYGQFITPDCGLDRIVVQPADEHGIIYATIEIGR